MMPILTYRPDNGVSLNDTQINWGFDRPTVRHLLGNNHKESNSVINLSKYQNGNNNYDIIQRRDIYQDYTGQENYFFLNYDKDDFLTEVELHNGLSIFVRHIKLTFDMGFPEAVSSLQSISNNNKPISMGGHFFRDLKLTIASNGNMGGDSNTLAYFYCSQNVDHLTTA